jgi:DNA repair protein RecO (recombination protein O)
MTLHRSDAIILKRDRSGESSLLLEVFLKNQGRSILLAKGARKPGSSMVGKLEPFSEVELLYYRKNDESLGVISQVEQKRSNNELSGDIRRLSYASAVVEALKGMVYRGEEEQEAMYDLLAGTFYMLNYALPRKLEFFFLVFLLKSLDLIGLSPQFEHCVKSGKPIEGDEILFSVDLGGVISKTEAPPENHYFKLDRGIINSVKKARESDIDKLKGLAFTEKQSAVIKDLLFSFLSYHTEGKPGFNSLNFLSKLANY